MKKLYKLKINSEKIMNNAEMLELRGGYGSCCCKCYDWEGQQVGYIANATALNCNPLCLEFFGHGFGNCSC
jgi:hypothetical protein